MTLPDRVDSNGRQWRHPESPLRSRGTSSLLFIFALFEPANNQVDDQQRHATLDGDDKQFRYTKLRKHSLEPVGRVGGVFQAQRTFQVQCACVFGMGVLGEAVLFFRWKLGSDEQQGGEFIYPVRFHKSPVFRRVLDAGGHIL